MSEKKPFTRVTVLILAVFFGLPALFAGGNSLKVTTAADNLYLIRGMKWDVCAVFLVTGEGVLVVDSGNGPGEGRMIVEKIKEKTGKPIKYVVITHYHFDHTWGLSEFPKAAEIIAHTNCAKNITNFSEKDRKEVLEEGLPGDIEKLGKKIVKLEQENNPGLKEEKKKLERLKQEIEEVKRTKVVCPTTTFNKKKSIILGGEKVEIIYPGRTHTDGSIIVYFPGKKAVVMGDILFHGYHPFIDERAGSDTANWIVFLKQLSKWNIEKVIPGHGRLTGKEAFKHQVQYLTDLRNLVKEAVKKGLSLEETKKSFKMAGYDHLEWPDMLQDSSIEAVYLELKKSSRR
ncbi:MAG: MBL fold metallo-hydrolase [Candidatus Aminicenantes bacterium]|nr:MBL fold metallo-hydrolase [Candidatus Aminicenantes bacterium]